MGRAPCCDKANVKKGPWSPEEDAKLKSYIEQNGTGGNWIALPQKIGLRRCGKSCRLRWLNYLRPNIKHGGFSEEEENIICNLYISIGSRWSIIAAQLPGRTDNDIKNYWNTRLKKKLMAKQRKEQAANRVVGVLDHQDMIKREQSHNNNNNNSHEMFLVNQALNQQHHQLMSYWADPNQLSMPMVNPNQQNPDNDQLSRLLMKIGGQQVYEDPRFINSYQQQYPTDQYHQMYPNNANVAGYDVSDTGLNVVDQELTGNFTAEVEAYINNLLRSDQSYSSVDVGGGGGGSSSANTISTSNNSGAGSSSGSWGDMNNSLVNTPVSDFDAYQAGVLQAM